jgi:hypothetical protein
MKGKVRELGLIALAVTLLAFELVSLRVVVPMAFGAARARVGTVTRSTVRHDLLLVRRDGSLVTFRRAPVVVRTSTTCPRERVTHVAGTMFSAFREALL